MATTTIRDGIYRIEHVIYGGPVQYLTRSHGDVTILPSGGPSDPNQEVMCRFLTSSIVCCSPDILVANPQR